MGVVKRFRPLRSESRRGQPILEIAAVARLARIFCFFIFFCICLKNEMVEWFLPLAKGTGGIRFREGTAYLFLDGRNGEESSLCAR